jgi:hypothetical protein
MSLRVDGEVENSGLVSLGGGVVYRSFDVGDGPLNEKDGTTADHPTTTGISATPGCSASIAGDDNEILPFSIASSGCSVGL